MIKREFFGIGENLMKSTPRLDRTCDRKQVVTFDEPRAWCGYRRTCSQFPYLGQGRFNATICRTQLVEERCQKRFTPPEARASISNSS
ncbi:hypothetical protein Gain_0041_024 [Komagataeibacter intermedius TF2]|nr:hypothetical protein Gain_0041_024 [Komagataeibacter intermedius TF2]